MCIFRCDANVALFSCHRKEFVFFNLILFYTYSACVHLPMDTAHRWMMICKHRYPAGHRLVHVILLPKRNLQPSYVFDFEVVFSSPYEALCNVTLYSILFLYFLFYIYKVRIRTHARQRTIKKSCGLQVAFFTPTLKRNFAILQLQLCNHH